MKQMLDPRATRHHLGTLRVDGGVHNVSVRISYDGVEHVGRLWFVDSVRDVEGIPDYGVIPGRTADDVLAAARQMGAEDLTRRFHRAHAEKRRYIRLRRSVEEILAKVKYMNRVAISMRGGMLDVDAAEQELDLVTDQIQDIVSRLKDVAA
ncbi:MAG: hypothetical protein WDZ58_03805 [Gemmatimonadaceae bacterium]